MFLTKASFSFPAEISVTGKCSSGITSLGFNSLRHTDELQSNLIFLTDVPTNIRSSLAPRKVARSGQEDLVVHQAWLDKAHASNFVHRRGHLPFASPLRRLRHGQDVLSNPSKVGHEISQKATPKPRPHPKKKKTHEFIREKNAFKMSLKKKPAGHCFKLLPLMTRDFGCTQILQMKHQLDFKPFWWLRQKNKTSPEVSQINTKMGWVFQNLSSKLWRHVFFDISIRQNFRGVLTLSFSTDPHLVELYPKISSN